MENTVQSGPQSEKADLSAWLAVLAGTISSFMATLDISIVNAALPTIQGEVGASGTEGTWISTSYLVAEIIMIPLTGWFVRTLKLRNFLIICAAIFVSFSVICGISDSLMMMVIGRLGQGFAGGALIPTAIIVVATRLPRSQQPVGTALFGMTVILGPIIGPLLGGWLTENFSWHYAFFVNVPVCAGLFVLLFTAMPHENAQWRDLLKIDLLGFYGLAAGLGGLTVVLEEGQRERWFESAFIIKMTILTISGFLSLIGSQFQSRRPVVRLSLLLERSFCSVVIVVMSVGLILFGVMFMIPQFLSTVAGYNTENSGLVVLLSGIPTIVLLPFVPKLLKLVDVRILVGSGLAFFFIACYLNSNLTADVGGVHFVAGQLVQGCGLALTMLPLNQAAISSVSQEHITDASGLFSAARNLGGSIGLALISTYQDRRLDYHLQTIGSSVTANSVKAQDAISGYAHQLGNTTEALAKLWMVIQRQALVMTYSDLFWIFAFIIVGTMPLILLMKPIRDTGVSHAMH